jgi:O-antigen ligase
MAQSVTSWRIGPRQLGLFLLISASAYSAPLLVAGSLTFTGDRLLGLAAVAAAALVAVRGGLRWTPVHSALAAFTVIQVLTALLAASSWSQGPKFSSIYILGFACFALTCEWSAGREGLWRAARLWIAIGAILGFAGALLSLLANFWQTPLWGTGASEFAEIRPGVSVIFYAAKVTFNEWNLYSSFLLVAFALALWAWQPRTADSRPRQWSGFLPVSGIALGLVFGLTRAAWVSMTGLLAFWLWARRPTRQQVGALVAVVALGFVVQAGALGGSPLYHRIVKPLKMGKDYNMAGRVEINEATIESSRERPFLGQGAGSTNSLKLPTIVPPPQVKPWNGNLVLFVLHDSGLLGLASLVGLVTVVVVAARRALRVADGAARPVLVPLLAAGVALLFAYQFTHGLWLMYPYVYLGFLTAAMNSDAPSA